jgi:hypothetical protein
VSDHISTTAEFPVGLLKWAGHRGGGVKRPFHAGSGRPSGQSVETPIIKRLRVWVDNLIVSPEKTQKAVILVGGPGNGKTDAIQVLIEYLDAKLGTNGDLVKELTRIYTSVDGSLTPRLVSLKLTSLNAKLPSGFPDTLHIVQDASEDPRQTGISRGKLLATELLQSFKSPDEAVYICCANRGVVSEALSGAKSDDTLADVVQVLENLLEAVTSGPNDISCWPLKTAPSIAAWPMDVESLTVKGAKQEAPVCQSFIDIAVDAQRWPTSCSAGSKCPFCYNRGILSTQEAKDSLSDFLRYYELGSGKRWTFRDLFSLIPHIIVGDDQEYTNKAGQVIPCDWAADQLKAAEPLKKETTTEKSIIIKLKLVSKLYQHRLFPLWPNFRAGAHHKAVKELAALKAKELNAAIGLFSWLGARRLQVDTDISKLISSSWSNMLDPAVASGNDNLIESKKHKYTIQDVEERFSLSISDGFEMVKMQISELEREVLGDLAISDDYLASQAYPRKLNSSARLVQQVLRQFACRLVKRSIGTRRGICNNLSGLSAYRDASVNPEELRTFRRSLQSLLHDDRNRFTASLATTFGQPAPYRERDVRLITSKVLVKIVSRQSSYERPIDPIPYVRIGNKYEVPVTMELFTSLANREDGLRDASLPPAVFALFDTTRSIVTGEITRDPRVLEEDVIIEIGGSRQQLHLEDGKISVTTKGESHVN